MFFSLLLKPTSTMSVSFVALIALLYKIKAIFTFIKKVFKKKKRLFLLFKFRNRIFDISVPCNIKKSLLSSEKQDCGLMDFNDQIFNKMKLDHFKVDSVTIINVLSACLNIGAGGYGRM